MSSYHPLEKKMERGKKVTYYAAEWNKIIPPKLNTCYKLKQPSIIKSTDM